jgi:hypothetical protein
MTSTEKVSEVPTGEETSLSDAPAERTINVTNYGSMSTDDGASQPGASDGSATPAKKERRSSIRRRSSITDDDDDAVAVGPGLDTIIQGAFVRQ